MNVKRTFITMGVTAIAAGFLLLLSGGAASAHCDTLDGPVIATARIALEKGDVTPVLKWIKPEHETEIRENFNRTLSVRELGSDAKNLADTYFFETLVRIHRAGEGAPYTGLKPAGEVEPPIAAADKALETGNIDGLIKNAQHEVEAGIREKFQRVVETSKHKDESVEAGREYVEAYVIYTHYIEGFHNYIHRNAEHNEKQAEPSGHIH